MGPFSTFGLTVDDEAEFQEFFKIQCDKYYFYNEKFTEHFVEKMVKSFEELDLEGRIQVQFLPEERFL